MPRQEVRTKCTTAFVESEVHVLPNKSTAAAVQRVVALTSLFWEVLHVATTPTFASLFRAEGVCRHNARMI